MPDSNHFTIRTLLSAPKHSLIYLVSDSSSDYAVKIPRHTSSSVLEAYTDEFLTLKELSHPVLPSYYYFFPEIALSPSMEPAPALFMEYIDGIPLSSVDFLMPRTLKQYMLELGDALLTLLAHGVLYTDLHPGNLLIENGSLRLIDFTCAYYYKRNPYPSYTPKISYHLNQHLKGQQLLIQALTCLFLNLPDNCPAGGIPRSLIRLGMHPHSGISFKEFLSLLDREWII